MRKNLLLPLVLLVVHYVSADEQAEKLLSCIESSGLGQTSGFMMRQVIKKEGQTERKFKAECYLTNKAEKMLIKFEDPADMAGVKLLLRDRGKQMWTYFPRTNRVRKMAGASSGQQIGSLGFSYSDLFPYTEGSSYSTKVLEDKEIHGAMCKVVEIHYSSESESDYKKAHVFIEPGKCLLRQSEFFGDGNRSLKTVLFKKYESVENHTIPTAIRITQPDLGEESNISVLAAEFKKDYGPTFFSERSLKR